MQEKYKNIQPENVTSTKVTKSLNPLVIHLVTFCNLAVPHIRFSLVSPLREDL